MPFPPACERFFRCGGALPKGSFAALRSAGREGCFAAEAATGAPPLDPAGFCKAGETYGCSCVNELCFAQRGVNAEGIYSVRSVCIRAASSRLERRVCTPTCKPYGLPHGAKRIFALCECPNVSLAFLKSAPSKVEPWSRSAEREALFDP